MQIATTLYAAMFGTLKVQEPFVPKDLSLQYRSVDSRKIVGYLEYNKNLSSPDYHYATWYRNVVEFNMKRGGRKVRIPKKPKTDPMSRTNDSNSSVTSSSIQACPVNVAPLSLFDPTVTDYWNDAMDLVCTSNSLTYETDDLGVLTLLVQDNSFIVKKKVKMYVSIITPGHKIKALNEGDKIDITPDHEHILIVSNVSNADTFVNAQDNVYFYSKGIYTASSSLLRVADNTFRDILRVGVAPKWVKYNDYEPFVATMEPVRQFDGYLRDDVLELADYVMTKIFQQKPTPVKPTNVFAGMNAFYSASGLQQSTILEYFNTIKNVNDACITAFGYNQSNPAMITILAEVVRRLLAMNKQELFMTVYNSDNYNVMLSNFVGPSKDIMTQTAAIFGNLIRNDIDFDYDKVQNDARNSLPLATNLFTFINQQYPYFNWVWTVSGEIDKKYKLPRMAKLFFDPYDRKEYNQMLTLVQENFDLCIGMIPNLMHRLKSNIDDDTCKSFAEQSADRILSAVSASVVPEKGRWLNQNYLPYLTTLPRYINDIGFDSSTDASTNIAQAFTATWYEDERLALAQNLALRLVLNNFDDNIYRILTWIPPYFDAYVYDNLNAVGIPNKLSPGVNPWTDQPCTDILKYLLSWANFDWPSNRPFKITAYLNDGDYDQARQWLSLSKASTALVFKQPWSALDPNNLTSILTKGADTVAVQSNTNQTVTIYIAASQFNYLNVYHMHVSTGICEYYGTLSNKPWSKSVKAEAGDFIMVLNSYYQREVVAKWVTESVKGVQGAENIRFILTTFMNHASESLFHIST